MASLDRLNLLHAHRVLKRVLFEFGRSSHEMTFGYGFTNVRRRRNWTHLSSSPSHQSNSHIHMWRIYTHLHVHKDDIYHISK